MGKRVRVQLHGISNNRGVLVDADATEGARVGRNLLWPDGTVVEEDQIRGSSTTTTTTTTGSAVQPTLWSLILNIPSVIKDLVAMTGPGYIYHDGTALSSSEWPLHDTRIETGEVLAIPAYKQYIIWQEMVISGDLEIMPGGELVMLDEGLPEPTDPDFTYSGGNLSQIDFDGGEQKLFTYNGSGDLTRVDFINGDGFTYRKDLFYSGGDLDYIDEYYV